MAEPRVIAYEIDGDALSINGALTNPLFGQQGTVGTVRGCDICIDTADYEHPNYVIPGVANVSMSTLEQGPFGATGADLTVGRITDAKTRIYLRIDGVASPAPSLVLPTDGILAVVVPYAQGDVNAATDVSGEATDVEVATGQVDVSDNAALGTLGDVESVEGIADTEAEVSGDAATVGIGQAEGVADVTSDVVGGVVDVEAVSGLADTIVNVVGDVTAVAGSTETTTLTKYYGYISTQTVNTVTGYKLLTAAPSYSTSNTAIYTISGDDAVTCSIYGQVFKVSSGGTMTAIGSETLIGSYATITGWFSGNISIPETVVGATDALAVKIRGKYGSTWANGTWTFITPQLGANTTKLPAQNVKVGCYFEGALSSSEVDTDIFIRAQIDTTDTMLDVNITRSA